MASFYISAAHKSSGKTTLSIGLSAAIRKQNLSIQTFKKGPDYIDPIWLSQASGSPCYNLDFFTSSNDFILNQFNQYSQSRDAVLVEGNMGLFDGISVDGNDSNAAMARLLNIPVLLVLDCSGTSRGIAPLLLGYQQFDPTLTYAGVIFNKVAGQRHETKLRQVVEAYTDFKILGAVPRNNEIKLTERHLGLIPSNEMANEAEAIIDLLAVRVSQFVDIPSLLTNTAKPAVVTESIENLRHPSPPVISEIPGDVKTDLKIGIARDAAFGFYYPGDLHKFEQLGVELVPFDCLRDSQLPSGIDGLFIGGGFPETQVEKLSANQSMLTDIKHKIEAGLPAYAECGGLMYLARELHQDHQVYPLCDVIPASVNMNKRPQGRGYVILQARDEHPWQNHEVSKITQVKAHEFHYSALEGLPEHMNYAYAINRGTGIDGVNDGIILHNMLASYTHLRNTDECNWVSDFVSFVKRCKR